MERFAVFLGRFLIFQFNIVQGDFLDEKFLFSIQSADVIFVNNFAFGTQLNHQLKVSVVSTAGSSWHYHYLLSTVPATINI